MASDTSDRDRTADGRHARRDRNRLAVIEAMFALVREGKGPPEAADVAERAGVSISSIFRNFDGLADLQRQALSWYMHNYAHLFVVDDADAPLAVRIRSHVRSRTRLHEETGEMLRIARGRALDHQPMVEALSVLRGMFADQTRQRFAAEIGELTPAESANLVALVDSLTSIEAHEIMSAAHGRTGRQITRVWVSALESVLDATGDGTGRSIDRTEPRS